MMTLSDIENRLDDSIRNGTESDIHYWRGYRDATTAGTGIQTVDELRSIVDQLEFCGYKCPGGSLENNMAFIHLKRCAYGSQSKEVQHDC